MKICKVGNQTNSQDPQAVNSRIFVGNLNTFQCSKMDVERMFQRYGRLAGISMHKGFAFIQYTNPFDARSACLGEDGRTILGQTLDVNLVCEPKPHQIGRKRQNLSKTGNDWDYFYDSYYSSAFPTLEMVATPSPSAKRARLMITAPTRQQLAATIIPVKSRAKRSPSAGGNHHHMAQHHRKQKSPPQLQQLQQQQQQIPYQQAQQTSQAPLPLPTASASQLQHPEDQVVVISQLKTYSNPDILICGNCREMFGELSEMVQHKKTYCKVRFTCKCDTNSSTTTEKSVTNNNNKVTLLCVQCKESFESAWDLVVHAQAEHMINVYELGVQNSKFSTADFGTLENGFERNQIENNSKEDDTDDSDENTTVSEKSFKDIEFYSGNEFNHKSCVKPL